MKAAKRIISVLLSLALVFTCVAAAAPAIAATPQEDSDTSFTTSSITCNRHPFQPVYVKISGRSYNLLSPIGAVGAMVAAKTEQQKKTVAFTYMELMITDILNVIAGLSANAKDMPTLDEFESENFMAGNTSFIDSNEGGVWSLGYSQASLLPDDLLKGTKDYYLAGYLLQNLPSNTVETVLDDMKVRTIVLDDGSGRGKVAFATIECIGIANSDIRDIREMLADFAKQNNIISINVQSTHCHSEIDTLGLWNPFFGKIANNTLAAITGQTIFKTQGGPDEEFMQVLKERTAQSIKDAVAGMTTGKLYSCEKDGSEYMYDKRDPSSYDGNIYRLRFDPFDGSKKETMIVNMAAHPYITGLKTDNSTGKELSGDYTAAMDEVITGAGYNFMFFNGAILGIYADRGQTNDGVDMDYRWQQADRYGKEVASFVLSMTKTVAQIEASSYVDLDKIAAEQAASSDYTLWYKDWQPVEETEVKPILNIALKESYITVENPVMKAAGKLGLVDHTIIRNGSEYMTVTEVGYVEIGENIKVAMMPGEISPELIYGGGTLSAENSFSGCDFPGKYVGEILDLDEDDTLLCFGLANDEIGYILNDNDYCLLFFDDVEPFGDHYQESIAFGRSSGSSLMNTFDLLYSSVR